MDDGVSGVNWHWVNRQWEKIGETFRLVLFSLQQILAAAWRTHHLHVGAGAPSSVQDSPTSDAE